MGARKESLIPSLEVVHTWGGTPQREELFDGTAAVSIGEDGATFLLPGITRVELATPGEDSWTVRVPAGAEARADVDGRDVDLATLPTDSDGARLLRLPLGAHAEIVLGAHSFFARPTVVEPRPALAPVDVARYRFLLPSVALHALFLLGVFLVPPSAGALVVDIDAQDQRYLRFHTDADEMPLPTPTDGLTSQDSASSEGHPSAGAEGTAGNPDETRHTGGQVRVRGSGEDRRVPLTQTQASHAGILGALATMRFDSPVSSPFGAAEATGFSADNAYGDLTALIGFSAGSGGLGMIGGGRGGCPPGAVCDGAGTVGVGDLNVIGSNGHSCSPTEFDEIVATRGRAAAVDQCTGHVGTGVITGGGHTARVPPPVTPGTATLAGGLSREDVRRVITRNLSQVRNCYQQGLLGNPDLSGRVTVSFIITPTGAVASSSLDATHSDLPDATVSSCVANVVTHWSFPSADSVTMVSYPFRLDTTP